MWRKDLDRRVYAYNESMLITGMLIMAVDCKTISTAPPTCWYHQHHPHRHILPLPPDSSKIGSCLMERSCQASLSVICGGVDIDLLPSSKNIMLSGDVIASPVRLLTRYFGRIWNLTSSSFPSSCFEKINEEQLRIRFSFDKYVRLRKTCT